MTLLGVYLMQNDVSNRIANSLSSYRVLRTQEDTIHVVSSSYAKPLSQQ